MVACSTQDTAAIVLVLQAAQNWAVKYLWVAKDLMKPNPFHQPVKEGFQWWNFFYLPSLSLVKSISGNFNFKGKLSKTTTIRSSLKLGWERTRNLSSNHLCYFQYFLCIILTLATFTALCTKGGRIAWKRMAIPTAIIHFQPVHLLEIYIGRWLFDDCLFCVHFLCI